MINRLHVKKGDTVIVVSGKDKGKKGKVMVVSPKEKKIIVEGVSIVTKHVKPKKQGQAGGIIKTEGAFYACKAMLYCNKCNKPTRIATKLDDKGKKVRICKHCGVSL